MSRRRLRCAMNSVNAGWFLQERDKAMVIFEAMPEDFLLQNVKDWYTNEVGGLKFKVQLMRSKGEPPTITGANLRPANYREPKNGFVFYLARKLQGTVVNYHGAKSALATPDAEGKVRITKDTVEESYWSHPRNPVKPELGSVSGLTELTLRKIPPLAK